MAQDHAIKWEERCIDVLSKIEERCKDLTFVTSLVRLDIDRYLWHHKFEPNLAMCIQSPLFPLLPSCSNKEVKIRRKLVQKHMWNINNSHQINVCDFCHMILQPECEKKPIPHLSKQLSEQVIRVPLHIVLSVVFFQACLM
jgi:hypothetical protein